MLGWRSMMLAAAGGALNILLFVTPAAAAPAVHTPPPTAVTPLDSEFCYPNYNGNLYVATWCDFSGAGHLQITGKDKDGNIVGFFSVKVNANGSRHLEICDYDVVDDFIGQIFTSTGEVISYPDAYGGGCKQGDKGYAMLYAQAVDGDAASTWEPTP